MSKQVPIIKPIKDYLRKKSTDELFVIMGYVNEMNKSFNCNIKSEDIPLMKDFLEKNLPYLGRKYYYNKKFVASKNRIIFGSTANLYFVIYEKSDYYTFDLFMNKEQAEEQLYTYINLENNL